MSFDRASIHPTNRERRGGDIPSRRLGGGDRMPRPISAEAASGKRLAGAAMPTRHHRSGDRGKPVPFGHSRHRGRRSRFTDRPGREGATARSFAASPAA
jgi:hypothetical protein